MSMSDDLNSFIRNHVKVKSNDFKSLFGNAKHLSHDFYFLKLFMLLNVDWLIEAVSTRDCC